MGKHDELLVADDRATKLQVTIELRSLVALVDRKHLEQSVRPEMRNRRELGVLSERDSRQDNTKSKTENAECASSAERAHETRSEGIQPRVVSKSGCWSRMADNDINPVGLSTRSPDTCGC